MQAELSLLSAGSQKEAQEEHPKSDASTLGDSCMSITAYMIRLIYADATFSHAHVHQ